MKIISISLDQSILDRNSIASEKTVEYASLVDKYIVLVPYGIDQKTELSDRAIVYGVRSTRQLLKWWGIYRLARRLVKDEKPDLVTTQDPFEIGLIGYLLKIEFGISWQTQEHGDFFSRPYWRQESFLNHFRYYLGIFLIKRADGIRAVSQRIVEYLASDMRISKERILRVPVQTEADKFIFEPVEKSRENFIFLNMGRFVRQKNLPLLIKAFTRVYEKNNQARLRLIGSGPLEQELKDLVQKNNIASAVEFYVWTDKVSEQYHLADAYVLSSDYEGWGRVIVEAALSGLPIVMTEVGCAGELIVGEQSGLVTPVRDEDKLFEAMIKIMTDRELGERFAQKACEAAKRLPDKRKTLELYKESWEKTIC